MRLLVLDQSLILQWLVRHEFPDGLEILSAQDLREAEPFLAARATSRRRCRGRQPAAGADSPGASSSTAARPTRRRFRCSTKPASMSMPGRWGSIRPTATPPSCTSRRRAPSCTRRSRRCWRRRANGKNGAAGGASERPLTDSAARRVRRRARARSAARVVKVQRTGVAGPPCGSLKYEYCGELIHTT